MDMNIEKIEAAKKLGEALEHLVQFTSFYNRCRDSVLPRKFFLKNILGFSEEDYEQIEKELIEEAAYKKYLDKKIEARMRQMEVDGDFDEDSRIIKSLDAFHRLIRPFCRADQVDRMFLRIIFFYTP